LSMHALLTWSSHPIKEEDTVDSLLCGLVIKHFSRNTLSRVFSF
jgi:predicted RNase H-like nuclease